MGRAIDLEAEERVGLQISLRRLIESRYVNWPLHLKASWIRKVDGRLSSIEDALHKKDLVVRRPEQESVLKFGLLAIRSHIYFGDLLLVVLGHQLVQLLFIVVGKVVLPLLVLLSSLVVAPRLLFLLPCVLVLPSGR